MFSETYYIGLSGFLQKYFNNISCDPLKKKVLVDTAMTEKVSLQIFLRLLLHVIFLFLSKSLFYLCKVFFNFDTFSAYNSLDLLSEINIDLILQGLSIFIPMK